MNNVKIWQNSEAIDIILSKLADDLKILLIKQNIINPLMVGIHTGGIWVAQYLHQALQLQIPLGALDISFYRDDFTKIGLHPLVRPSTLPVAINDRHIILVDDILHTGRTVRAALNALFDYGRPASVLFVVLVKRSGRELPIEPDLTGQNIKIAPEQHLKLEGPHPLRLVFEQTRSQPK